MCFGPGRRETGLVQTRRPVGPRKCRRWGSGAFKQGRRPAPPNTAGIDNWKALGQWRHRKPGASNKSLRNPRARRRVPAPVRTCGWHPSKRVSRAPFCRFGTMAARTKLEERGGPIVPGARTFVLPSCGGPSWSPLQERCVFDADELPVAPFLTIPDGPFVVKLHESGELRTGRRA
jgi:hypothetical protein